jgi:cellulose synthase/poly-beta-1,6-N-acetylglucosamine synthase-like glycosyltransferase
MKAGLHQMLETGSDTMQLQYLIPALLLFLISTAYLAAARKGLRAARKAESSPSPDVCVLIAVHNEEHSLPVLLQSIARQSHPLEHVHLIVGFDRCTDESRRIVEEATDGRIKLSMVEVDAVPDGISPKKYVLDKMIEEADTDKLLFTDADCEPGRTWIASMCAALDESDAVLGLSPVRQADTCVSRVAAYDSWRTAFLMCGAAGNRHAYMSVGRNWAYRRQYYMKCGGLRPLFGSMSGDDDLLLQRFVSEGASIGVCLDSEAACPTNAPDSLSALMKQKSRHMSAGTHYSPFAAFHLSVLWLSCFTCLLSPLAFVTGMTAVTAICTTVAAVAVTVLNTRLILSLTRRINMAEYKRLICNAVLLEPISLILAGAASLPALRRRRVW